MVRLETMPGFTAALIRINFFSQVIRSVHTDSALQQSAGNIIKKLRLTLIHQHRRVRGDYRLILGRTRLRSDA